jgi:hypothetical protein
MDLDTDPEAITIKNDSNDFFEVLILTPPFIENALFIYLRTV